MNIENMEKVIAAIEAAPDKRFNSHAWIHDKRMPIHASHYDWRKGEQKALVEFEERDCGTSACIAGWTVVTLVPPEDRVELDESAAFAIADKAQRLLGLNDREAHWLFYGEYSRLRMSEITKAQAVAEMRRMVVAEREGTPL